MHAKLYWVANLICWLNLYSGLKNIYYALAKALSYFSIQRFSQEIVIARHCMFVVGTVIDEEEEESKHNFFYVNRSEGITVKI